MGTSESKMTGLSTPKPDPVHQLMARRLAQLRDPRSPSCEINRTPIQVMPNHWVAKCICAIHCSHTFGYELSSISPCCCVNLSALYCVAGEWCSLYSPRSSRVSWSCVS